MKNRLIILIACICVSVSAYTQQGFKYTKSNSGIVYTVDGIKKRISFYSDKIVRVSLIKENKKFSDSSLVVITTPKQTDFTIKDGDVLLVKTASLTINIDKNTGTISFLAPSNKIYLEEHKRMLPQFKDTIIQNHPYYTVRQSFKLTKDEGLYGLGQFQDGYMNYRNKNLLLVQANKIAIVPMLTSTNNYGILWDNYSHTEFTDNDKGTTFTSAIADGIDYYFIAGEKIDDVIAGYRSLTGQAPMFSKKAFGYWQSKERYNSFGELHEVVKGFRDNNIPIDNIVQDWRYWGENDYWSSMYFEPEYFPNPSENIAKLKANHVDLMVSIWPSLGKESSIYKEMDEKGYLLNQDHWCGGKIYDAYSSGAREIYWKHIQEGLVKNGIHAFWMDGTEPEFSHTDYQEITEKEILKAEKTAAGPIAKYLNTYVLPTSQNVYQKHRELYNQERVFILTRSSWAGQQRNATVTWSGDVSANFDNLKNQISAGINFCMAGVPYWTHDIGAFFPSGRGGLYPKGIDDPAYQELYTRWFQFGAFSPIFRSHGTGTPREVYQFKERNPMCYHALLKTLNLRYQLLPYIYSTAWQVTNQGYTIMRGLVMDFPNDKNTYNIGDQYMFGASLMVKPITKSMYYELEKSPEVVPTENLRTLENKNGLDVSYFKDTALNELVYKGIDNAINRNWGGGGLPQGVPEFNFSVRWEGNLLATESGIHKISTSTDDGVRVWFNGKLVIDNWIVQAEKRYSFEVDLEKGKSYPIKVEYFQGTGGATASLAWETPLANKDKIMMTKSDNVYLPECFGWYDFWSNEYYKGGQTISKDFPMDIFPLYVKAGSILPLGPTQQYVGEKQNAPIEIRIYTGHDAELVFYEDEGNNYNYEEGKYNTIHFCWNEKDKKLNIGTSTGTFRGYVNNKIFNIKLITPSESDEDKLKFREIKYNGNAISINL